MIKTNILDKERSVSSNGETFAIDNADFPIIRRKIGHNHFHYQIGHKSHDVRIVLHEDKTYTVAINGEVVSVPYKTELDLMLEKMGLKDLLAAGNKEFKAPMPGMVLKILVAPGDAVSKGTPLIVLEAMKMENNIKAESDGVVKAVNIKEGQSVEKNQVMIEFE
ncbi:MAG: acetyl-CoA carboxylase biotin carboxyl carrier protein subunit [Cryomorphaceae bacterium]|nr:acetyl-CoA carboxylase biotin carboxyl carrier protein subunit [Cryomorphaceae bacterium]